MPTSPEGSFKSPDPLSPEHKKQLEADCEDACRQLRDGMKLYVVSGDRYVLPMAVIWGFSELMQPQMTVIPFTRLHPMKILAGAIREAVQRTRAVAFAVGYDGYTTISHTYPGKLDPATRKESIVTVWQTSWNAKSAVAIRYQRIGSKVEFEDPLNLDSLIGGFDTVFDNPQSTLN